MNHFSNTLSHTIHSYLDHLGGGLHKPDADKYSVFYSLCQAVFYVFVFRHRSLLEMEGGQYLHTAA